MSTCSPLPVMKPYTVLAWRIGEDAQLTYLHREGGHTSTLLAARFFDNESAAFDAWYRMNRPVSWHCPVVVWVEIVVRASVPIPPSGVAALKQVQPDPEDSDE